MCHKQGMQSICSGPLWEGLGPSMSRCSSSVYLPYFDGEHCENFPPKWTTLRECRDSVGGYPIMCIKDGHRFFSQ